MSEERSNRTRVQAPLIALFNHKGGVSKTTTTFNLGWALADQGKKVLIVDGDPQCNLTGTVLGFEGIDDFSHFYTSRPRSNISACLEAVFRGTGTPLDPAHPVETSHPNLFLLAGNIDLAANETQLAVSLTTSTAIPALANMPGSICELLRITARSHEIDVVLIDMSPSVGALNECFLMGSDYFIVPTSPDYYCKQAITSLARVVPNWDVDVSKFRAEILRYKFPKKPPKFCGIISQRYRPRLGGPAKSFQKWIDVVKQTVNEELIPTLRKSDMCVTEAEFLAAHPQDTPYNLANIADFNSLIAQSQRHNKPVFALSDAEIDQAGMILETMKKSRDTFRETFEGLARSVTILTHL
ncbi:ParA family protein [Acetobacter tropicalis]|uniref:ParA family protein n=1 Tax=Acetobacter tropicalis TaxID=104102 RepID=UPI000A3CC51A|nr:AAA family ATPase [Acetobacter tropicalis]